MKLLLEILFFILALAFLIPCIVLFLECCVALLSSPFDSREIGARPSSIAVLVPAHNEENGIVSTLKTIMPQLTPHDRLLVIADNCTDNTAEIVRQQGVTVIERQNSQQRGKGHALNYGVRFLEADPPEVVVTVDGDCLLEENTVDAIARLAYSQQRPVQATYLMDQPANPTAKDTLSALAVIVKNLVRPYGLTKLGWPCLLTGSGMAFPWPVIRQAPLANSKTADDMQLSIDLAIAGYPALFCPAGRVRGRLMEQELATSQRSRWEHGHLENVLTEAPRLLKAALLQGRLPLLGLALELAVPPLSLLLMLWGVGMASAILGRWLGLSWIPALIFLVGGLLILLAILMAWGKFGRPTIPGSALFGIPFYLLWKIPLYLAFLVNPQSRWLKTERD